jgi:hypothetical protein
MRATAYSIGRPPATDSTRHRKRPADPAMSPDHLGVVRVNSAWIVHSSLQDEATVARPPPIRRAAGRR